MDWQINILLPNLMTRVQLLEPHVLCGMCTRIHTDCMSVCILAHISVMFLFLRIMTRVVMEKVEGCQGLKFYRQVNINNKVAQSVW